MVPWVMVHGLFTAFVNLVPVQRFQADVIWENLWALPKVRARQFCICYWLC